MSVAVVARWLRADPRDVVQVVPTGSGAHDRAATPAGVADELGQWCRGLHRIRLIVLIRRHLIVALLLALTLEVVALGLGAPSPELYPVGATVLLLLGSIRGWRARPTLSATARLLDREFQLSARVSTAVEITAGGEPPRGLSRRVVAEAGQLLGTTVRTGRPALRRAPAEWTAAAGAAIALVLLLAVTHGVQARTSAARPGSTRGSAALRGPTGGAPGAAHPAGRHSSTGPRGSASRPGAHPTSIPGAPGMAAPRTASSQPSPAGAPGRRGAPGPSGGRAGSHGAAASPANPPATSSPQGSPGQATGAAGGAHIARPATAPAPLALVDATRSPRRGGTPAPARPGTRGVTSARHPSPPGGGSAGRQRGTTRDGHALSSSSTRLPGRLPIQSGFAPARSAATTRPPATAPARAGGAGSPRSVRAGGSPGQRAAGLPLVPATGGGVIAADRSIVLRYFAERDRLSPAW
ncbi:MAG TPA: hypothetical protein VMW47_12665 [Verrucomicrobiae bacterium]|nr:hypothetical protein [Verrucomicrobiae bacterium]